MLLLLAFLSIKASAQEIYTLFDAKEKSHIFFGEHHNNAIAHWLELALTKALHQQHGSNLVIGMEMFNGTFANQHRYESGLHGVGTII